MSTDFIGVATGNGMLRKEAISAIVIPCIVRLDFPLAFANVSKEMK